MMQEAACFHAELDQFAVARDIQTGAAYNDDATELLSVGGPPLLLEPVQADLTLAGVTKVTALDVDAAPTT